MHEYEIFIEDINPCGGEQYSKKTLIEAEAASPEAYVKENGRFPILETTSNENGDVVIVTGDNKPSAHFEHTIIITRDGYEILTGDDNYE